MRNGLGRTQLCVMFVLSLLWMENSVSDCQAAEGPDPITLIQGVEMARLRTPPSRLTMHVVFRDPLRKNESDYLIEFDEDRRRSAFLNPEGNSKGKGLFYDGEQACLYNPSIKQASFRGLDDSTADPLFDPRIIGLSSGLQWVLKLADVLPYKSGKVELVGKEQIQGTETWHVRIAMEMTRKYQIDVWIGDTEAFPVYRYDMTFDDERRSIISFYENKNYPWLPSKAVASRFNNDGSFRDELTVTIDKAEANLAFSETNWTLAGLNLPEGTAVIDRRTKLTLGFWNGTNITPWEVWNAKRLAKTKVYPPSERSKVIVWIFLAAMIVVPLVIWTKSRRENISS